jgi:ribosomal protein S18 acetylase RimI-like enzyme
MQAGSTHAANIDIRQATVADIDILLDLSSDTFYQAFATQNTSDNMSAYMTSAFTKEQLYEELTDSSCIFFLAFLEDEIAGYCKLRKNKKHEALQAYQAIEIHRLYVLKTMIGKKIGKRLMEKCLEFARENNYEVVWLGVWEHNSHAIAFYKNWGFNIFSSYVFRLGNEDQTDYLMKKHIF